MAFSWCAPVQVVQGKQNLKLQLFCHKTKQNTLVFITLLEKLFKRNTFSGSLDRKIVILLYKEG